MTVKLIQPRTTTTAVSPREKTVEEGRFHQEEASSVARVFESDFFYHEVASKGTISFDFSRCTNTSKPPQPSKAIEISLSTNLPKYLPDRNDQPRSRCASSDTSSDGSLRVLTPTSDMESSPRNSHGTHGFTFDMAPWQETEQEALRQQPTSDYALTDHQAPLVPTSPTRKPSGASQQPHIPDTLAHMIPKIQHLVPPTYHEEVTARLTPSALPRSQGLKSDSDSVDILALSTYLASLLLTSCAPQRDATIHALVADAMYYPGKRDERWGCEILERWVGVLEGMEMVSFEFFCGHFALFFSFFLSLLYGIC